MRSKNRTHNRHSFFKYMSASTAAIVLKNCTLRWSSPLLFNDPFDVPRELSFGISSEAIVRALSDRITKLIEHPPEDLSKLEPRLRLLIETVKKGISSELKTQLIAGLTDSAETLRPEGQSMNELRAMWQSFLPDFRILCLTESAAHSAMWFHYADQYRGVVLEFQCNDELDSAWLGAKPVTYPAQKPDVYTADGWAKLLTSVGEDGVGSLLEIATYTKAPDWSYENEWRITSFKKEPEVGLFTDYRFNPQELAGVYLGPKMESENRQVMKALAAKFSDVTAYDVSIGMSREIVFSTATS